MTHITISPRGSGHATTPRHRPPAWPIVSKGWSLG